MPCVAVGSCILFSLDIQLKNPLPNRQRFSTVWALVGKRLCLLIKKPMDQATIELVHCLNAANPGLLLRTLKPIMVKDLRTTEKLSLAEWKSITAKSQCPVEVEPADYDYGEMEANCPTGLLGNQIPS